MSYMISQQRIFRNACTIYIENVDQKMNFLYDSDETEIRLPFLHIFLNILEYIWWSLHLSFLFIDMG